MLYITKCAVQCVKYLSSVTAMYTQTYKIHPLSIGSYDSVRTILSVTVVVIDAGDKVSRPTAVD